MLAGAADLNFQKAKAQQLLSVKFNVMPFAGMQRRKPQKFDKYASTCEDLILY